MNSSKTGVSFKLLVHKFRALVTQDPCELCTMKGLQLEIQSINAKTSLDTAIADLFSTGTKNGIKIPDLSCAAAIK